MNSTNVRQLGTIMAIWAHPDDETFMVGGLLATASDNSHQVICVTATYGEAGVQNAEKWPPATLGQTRANELAAAEKIIGISTQHFLGYPDGGLAELNEAESIDKLVQLIEQYKPDTIITFAPDGLTGHPDHQTVSRWTAKAAVASQLSPKLYYAVHTQELFDAVFKKLDKQLNIYFKTDKPRLVPAAHCDIHLSLDAATLGKKLAALEAMPSQYEQLFAQISRDDLEIAFGTEALVEASKWDAL